MLQTEVSKSREEVRSREACGDPCQTVRHPQRKDAVTFKAHTKILWNDPPSAKHDKATYPDPRTHYCSRRWPLIATPTNGVKNLAWLDTPARRSGALSHIDVFHRTVSWPPSAGECATGLTFAKSSGGEGVRPALGASGEGYTSSCAPF